MLYYGGFSVTYLIDFIMLDVKTSSHLGKIKGGILQGSALSPLLFLMYVNTLPSIINAGTLLQYADDTTLICSGSTFTSAATVMNSQL